MTLNIHSVKQLKYTKKYVTDKKLCRNNDVYNKERWPSKFKSGNSAITKTKPSGGGVDFQLLSLNSEKKICHCGHQYMSTGSS